MCPDGILVFSSDHIKKKILFDQIVWMISALYLHATRKSSEKCGPVARPCKQPFLKIKQKMPRMCMFKKKNPNVLLWEMFRHLLQKPV